MEDRFRIARIEIGDNEFNERYRKVFNQMVLDYVETIVLNLPNSCQCDCEYCIDKYLRAGHMDVTKFLIRCRELLMTFPNAKNVCITGGNLDSENFLDFEANLYREIYYFDIYNFNMVIHDGIAYISTKFHNDGVCELRKMSIEEKMELVTQMSIGSKVAYVEKDEIIQCIFNN